MSFAKEVWDRLSAIDCSALVEKKGKLSYLSWANAWTLLMQEYPESWFGFEEDNHYGDTVEVAVTVTVQDGDKRLSRWVHLPVMDYKNNAIPNPTARDVSDSKMRCLVKCIALFGLGLFLYRGEDIPRPIEAVKAEPATREQKAAIKEYNEQKLLPMRWVSWCGVKENWSGLTKAQAESIIIDCKKKEQGE